MSEQKEYTIIVKGKRVPVTRKVYKAYYKEYEYARNITRKAKKHELSLEKLKEDGVNPAYMCTSLSPEDMVIQKETQAKLHKALSSLPKDEQKLIYEFFYHCCQLKLNDKFFSHWEAFFSRDAPRR